MRELRRTRAVRGAVVAAGIVMAALGGGAAQGQVARIMLVGVDGAITPVVADYIEDAFAEAEKEGFDLVIITLDTPGGLDISMREIVQTLLNSSIPSVVYVSPEGARAASAGTFITM